MRTLANPDMNEKYESEPELVSKVNRAGKPVHNTDDESAVASEQRIGAPFIRLG